MSIVAAALLPAPHLKSVMRQYLEHKMTAEDPKTLDKPYSYSRYFKKLDTEVMDDPCQDEP